MITFEKINQREPDASETVIVTKSSWKGISALLKLRIVAFVMSHLLGSIRRQVLPTESCKYFVEKIIIAKLRNVRKASHTEDIDFSGLGGGSGGCDGVLVDVVFDDEVLFCEELGEDEISLSSISYIGLLVVKDSDFKLLWEVIVCQWVLVVSSKRCKISYWAGKTLQPASAFG